MKKHILKSTLILCGLGAAIAVPTFQAQENKQPVVADKQTKAETSPTNFVAEQQRAMKKLDFIRGDWRGKGWMMTGGGTRQTFETTETVRFKLDGLILVFEGAGKDVDANGKEIKGHDALGIVSYDPSQKAYRFKSYTMQGYTLDAPIEIGDKSFAWGLKIPNGGEMRYAMRINERGNWLETGEFSRDAGKTWVKVFEMEIERVK